VTWKFRANRETCSAFQQQLCYRETPIPILRYGVENWSLATDTGAIDGGTRIHVRSAIQKVLGCFRISKLGGDVQQRRSSEQ
jgi:hypothetical protein